MNYKVFISGNQTELGKERRAIKESIKNTPIIREFFEPFLFEDSPASGDTAEFTFIEEVKQSDIYIGILGNIYGKKNKFGISASETEYDVFSQSVTNGEKLIFIKGRDDESREPEVMKFFEKAREFSTYNRFESIEDLQNKIISSLESFLKKEGSISFDDFDERINPKFTYDMIDEDEVRHFLQKRAIKLDVGLPATSEKEILLSILKVIKESNGEIRPTNAGILFFSQDASNYIPQNEIRIARFDGVTRVNTIDSQELTGPIYTIIDHVESFFKRNTRTVPQIVGFKRIDISEYPYEAIREALINAIAHRDYNRKGAPIMFSIFDDRVEISSPGGLVSGVTLQNIGTKHETRNRRICAIFHETKDMEKFGTGIQKMRHYMQQHGLKEPEFKLEDDSFVVVFYGPGDKILDLASNIPDDKKIDLKIMGLNYRQIKAVKMMINQKIIFTNSKYQKQFGVSRYTASRDLKGIVDKDQAYVVGKGKATKYKATANDEA
jgi:predicted HTH transcriptional regulator